MEDILRIWVHFPCGSAGKEYACNAGDLGSTHGLGRSPGERKSYALQYSGLENSMDWIVMRSQRVRQDWVTFTSLWLLQSWYGLKKKKKKACIKYKEIVQFKSYKISSSTYLEINIVTLILFLFHNSHWSNFRED